MDQDHKNFLVLAVGGILGSVAFFVLMFMFLQYRSHGRCVWETSSSAILVDGNGFVQYSSLTDKDTDTLFEADDGFKGKFTQFGDNTNRRPYDYLSD